VALMPIDLCALHIALIEAVEAAGKLALRDYVRGGPTRARVNWKDGGSPVTSADIAVDAFLEEKLAPHFAFAWHSEERPESWRGAKAQPLAFVIDPIDGTKSFVHGVPFYSNLIALTDEKGPLVGVANFPALNETVYATRGGGCYWNGRRCRVSDVKDMKDAVALTSDIDYSKFKEKARAWQEIVSQTYFQRTWGDSYGYALVATGRAEIMVDPWMAIWDCGPLQVILEEAGGTFTDWKGTPTIYNGESFATNGHLYDEVFKIIKG